MNKQMKGILLLILLFIRYLNGDFSPNKSDYDAYGLKVAMNDVLLVEAQNGYNPPRFLIQFSPFNLSETSLQCYINYPNINSIYVYNVVVGKKQNFNSKHFFFGGELINGQNGTFIGLAKYKNSSNNVCDTSFSYFLQYLFNYSHEEYYIIGVEPQGRFAYGFSNKFIFIFDSENVSTLDSWDGNLTWPDDSFMPHAVEITDNFGIIAGFIRNDMNVSTRFSPIIYLLNINSSNLHPVVVNQYKPRATGNTWQDLLINGDADIYSAKYDMSISIDSYGNVLIGMQFINRVFLFNVNITNPIELIYISRNTNGRSLGNGKGVTWLGNGIAAVLVNTYSLNYQWSSSQIYFYDIATNGYNSTSIPLSLFPNNHQIFPIRFSKIFLNIVSSSSSLTLIDDQGNLLIFVPTPAGFCPFIEDTGLIPLITSSKACLPGTYKNQMGIYDCILCPTGTKNGGNSSTECVPCSPGSFCPLGSVDNVSQLALESSSQVIAYPKSPDSVTFDDVLIKNMFLIRSGRCLMVSPLLWVLVVIGLEIIIIIMMGVLKHFGKSSENKTKLRSFLKYSFKQIDLISEGEFWIGGLATLAVVVLVTFAFLFSNAYLKQYPIENSSDSYFACDLSIRNAKFDTNIQSLSIPLANDQQKMFDLLNNQNLNLNLNFINTLINCDVVSIVALFGTTWSTIRWSDCFNNNSILSISIPLPYQHISVQVLLDDIRTIGALGIGLTGSGYESEHLRLKELNFCQSFSKIGQLLSVNLPVALDLTKVINESLSLTGEKSNLSGIFIPRFPIDSNSLFQSIDQYVRSTISLTRLTVVIMETPYYVKNTQQPIVKQSELVFQNLLFALVCLEIFGFVFLSYKLVLKPLFSFFISKCSKSDEEQINGNPQRSNPLDENDISFIF